MREQARFMVAITLFALTGCASQPFQTQADAIPYCMTLGQVPARIDGQVVCW